MTDVPVMPAPVPKCATCNLKFESIDQMRKHYETEYHLNNIRLRVEGKKPLTQTEFRHSAAADGEDEGAPVFSCSLCKKSFRSIQTLQSHVKSTAHLMRKEQRILARDSEAASMLTSTSLGSAAMGLHRRHKTHHKAKEATATSAHKDPTPKITFEEKEADVDENRCFLCGLGFASMAENLEHMWKAHEFTIPLKHRVTDLLGLMQYIARKVNGLMCLTCGVDTKNVQSLSALRDHMKALGHDRIVLTTEYNEWYGNSLDDLEYEENEERKDQQLVVVDGKKTLFRRDGGGLYHRHKETEDQLTERKTILSAAQQATAVMRKERAELMRPEMTRQAKEFERREEQFYRQQLRVSWRANKLHPKGYDGEGEVN